MQALLSIATAKFFVMFCNHLLATRFEHRSRVMEFNCICQKIVWLTILDPAYFNNYRTALCCIRSVAVTMASNRQRRKIEKSPKWQARCFSFDDSRVSTIRLSDALFSHVSSFPFSSFPGLAAATCPTILHSADEGSFRRRAAWPLTPKLPTALTILVTPRPLRYPLLDDLLLPTTLWNFIPRNLFT